MILITGANGQLGRDFQQLFARTGVKYIATHHTAIDGYKPLDITNYRQVKDFVKENCAIRFIINCAAYNNVDKAEEEAIQAYGLNTYAPLKLALAAKAIDATLVHFSTDFVFDGEKNTPYLESDTPNPLSLYGESKYKGEQQVLQASERAYVIRTSWVYGKGNHNFTKSILNWATSRDELRVSDDQVPVPTYTKDLAAYTWDLVQTGSFGLFHIANSGVASKYDQARYVLDKIGWQGKLHPAKTSDFNLPARRAKYSKLDCHKAEELVGYAMPHWQDAIDRFLVELREAEEFA